MPDEICIKGRFGGHDVDLTISVPTEDDKSEGVRDDLTPPEDDAPAEQDAPLNADTPKVSVEASAEGEALPADPAPDEIERDDDVPPNPDGNAEQL